MNKSIKSLSEQIRVIDVYIKKKNYERFDFCFEPFLIISQKD